MSWITDLFKKKETKNTNDLNLTGNYSLNGTNTTTNNSGLNNPFAKKTTSTSLTTPTTQAKSKVNITNLINKSSNPYGFSSQNNTNADLSPTSLINKINKTSNVSSTPTSLINKTKDSQPTAFQQYLNSINKIAGNQKTNNATNLANAEKYYTNLYDTTNQSLLGQIPEGQQDLENYKASQQARVEKAKAALPGQEETVNTDYGAAQKVRAQTRNESEARLKNQFAGMNASDSYGAGSLTSELSGLENTFNAETASADVKRLDQIFKLRQDVTDVETEADSLVAAEELKLRSTIRSIQSQVGLNNIEKQNLIQQAYQASQDKVDEIDAYLAQLQYQQTETSGTKSTTGKVAAKDANIAKSGIDAIANIRSFISQNPNINKDINPLSSREYKATITNASDLIGRLRSGGAIQEAEEKRFRSLLPTYWDDANAINYKLNQLEQEFSNLLGVQTGGDELDAESLAYILSQL